MATCPSLIVSTVLALALVSGCSGGSIDAGGSEDSNSSTSDAPTGEREGASAEIKVKDKDGFCEILRSEATAAMVGKSVELASDPSVFVSGAPFECGLEPEAAYDEAAYEDGSRSWTNYLPGWGSASLFYAESPTSDYLTSAQEWIDSCGSGDEGWPVQGEVVEFKVNGAPAAMTLCTYADPEQPSGENTHVWIAARTQDEAGHQLGVLISSRGVGSLPDRTTAVQWATVLLAAAT